MSRSRTIYIIFHGRFPSEKAAALFAAKNASAFLEEGFKSVLIIPRVRKSRKALMTESGSFSISPHVPIIVLPVLDFFRIPFFGPVAFLLSYITFSLSLLWYFLFRAEEGSIWYSNESLPLFILSFFGAVSFYEMHDFPERSVRTYRFFLKRMRGLIITNTWKSNKAQATLKIPARRILVEQNAVSLEDFNIPVEKEEARKKLNLEISAPIVLYTGHLYGWKGVDTLALSAQQVPEAEFIFVGGREWDDMPLFREKHKNTPNIRITGHRPYQELALWQKAADVLVLPNSGREDISRFYTSPMKLFGYMASGRPIIASDLPSVREVVSDQAVLFIPPDDAAALSRAIKEVLADTQLQRRLATKALAEVQSHTWTARASRISSFIERRLMVG